MHEPTFRQALFSSWQLVSRKKSLWIFGLLSALLGQWGLSDFVGAFYREASNGFAPWRMNMLINLVQAWNWHRVSVILLVLWLLGILLLLVASIIFVAVCSRGALIAYAIHWYKKESVLPLHEAWNKGVKIFYPLLIVTVVGRGLQLILMGLFSFVALRLIDSNFFGQEFLILFVATISLFLVLVVEAISIFTSGYLLLENKNIQRSFFKGWNLFSHHLMVSLELGIVLMFFTVIFLGVVIYGSFAAFLPSLAMWVIAGITGFNTLIAFGMYSGMVLYCVLVLVSAGIFNAFVTCSWMYIFMKMHHEGVASRVVHFLKNIFTR